MGKGSWKEKIGRERLYSPDFEDRADIVQWDVISVAKEQLLKIKFISKNSPYSQGFRLAIDVGEGFIECNGDTAKGMKFWEDTAPKKFVVKCVSPEGLLSVYNIWDEGNGARSLMYCSGMIVEQQGNRIIYHCHDVGKNNVSFDKIVFSIEKI